MLQQNLTNFLNFACLVPLFKSLGQEELEILFQTFDYVLFKKGSVIVTEDNQQENHFYLIAAGRVKVSTISESGDEKIISLLEVGNSFGEMALLENRPRSASVIALEDSALYSLSSIAFFRMLELFPKVAIALLQDLSARIRLVNQLNTNSAFMTTPQRIRNYLSNLGALRGVRDDNGYLVIRDMPTQATIAHYLNCSRESVSREIQRLIVLGIVQKNSQKRLVIKDEKVLQN